MKQKIDNLKKVDEGLRNDMLLDELVEFIENISDIKVNTNFTKKYNNILKVIDTLYNNSLTDDTQLLNDNLTYIYHTLLYKMNLYLKDELYYKCHKINLLIEYFSKLNLNYANYDEI
jgi:hypothetical protein